MPVPLHSVQRLADNKSFAPVPSAIGEPGGSWSVSAPERRTRQAPLSMARKGVYQDLRSLEVLWDASNICPNFPEADFGAVRGTLLRVARYTAEWIASEQAVTRARSREASMIGCEQGHF